MTRIWTPLAIAILLTAPLLAACGDDNAGAEEAEQGPRAVSVTFIEAQPEPVEIVDSALATVETISAPRIAAEVSARVERLHADTGDAVRSGDLLAELDATDFEIARDRAAAEIGRLEARIENQERIVSRQQRLYEQGHTAEASLEEAETELRALERELDSARAQRRSAERDIDRTRVLAPAAGSIDARHVSESDFVQSGEPLFSLATGERLRIVAPFPETTAERLRPGMEIRLTTPAAPDRPVTAEIGKLRPVVGEGSRSVRAIAEIDNPGGWRPGASARAELVVEERENVVLPNQAVVRRPAGEVVYLLNDDTAVERAVKIGKRTRDEVEIVEGLSPGDRVIVDGAAFLSDGAPVRAEPQQED